jgi:hypothetical protein
MWTKLFTPNLELKFGLSVLAVGIVALIILLFFTGDLIGAPWAPLSYKIAYLAIPAGLLICLFGVAINLVDRSTRR